MAESLYRRARRLDVVYVPMARSLVDTLNGWSGPVEYRFQQDPDGHGLVRELVLRRVDAVLPLTEGQQRAYHAKVNAVALATGGDRDAIKAGILAEASEQFGRELTSSSELTATEAHWVLDRLDERANAVRA